MSSGKTITIPDNTIKQFMLSLDLTKEEAIQTYLEDEGLLENEEQIALNEKAKGFSHAVHDRLDKPKKEKRKVVVNVSDEKKALFQSILENIPKCDGISAENVTVLKENKLIQVQFGDKIFKIDLIQQRPPKK
jgi:hypothetical protein